MIYKRDSVYNLDYQYYFDFVKMNIVIVFLLGLLSLSQGREIGITGISTRIVNGQDAEVGEFPFQVSLQLHNGHNFCGGSVLSDRYVLTAAHCVSNKTVEEVFAVAGMADLREPFSKHTAIEFKKHFDYYETGLVNDIALIKIDPPFIFSDRIAPIELPLPDEVIPTNTSVIVSGWGNLVSTESGYPNILQKAEIYVADQEYCRIVMKERRQAILPTNICANDMTTRRGQCIGDSGGPLTIGPKQIGVVSFSEKDPAPLCASTKYPGVYTRLSKYLDWIVDNATV